ncbi:MAG: hypothetical protein OXQ94_02320 [Gemmatimonadota bacterium]|nr:hypothetical protein [Gemmatimonadota bacterium]MDE2870515.1 hypothetical protein [Gemmatimonadota bacterium]
MIRVPGKAAIALLHAVSAAFVVSSRDGYAQDRLGDRAQSMAALGAAVAEAQRSPFHRVGTAGSVIAPGARVAIVPPRGGVRRAMLREAGQDTATDEASKSEVFLKTAALTYLSDIFGGGLFLYGGLGGGYRSGGPTAADHLLTLSGAGVIVLGPPSLAAWFLGRDLMGALAGSFLGVVCGTVAGVAAEASGIPSLLAFSLGALVHAGAIALVANGGS